MSLRIVRLVPLFLLAACGTNAPTPGPEDPAPEPVSEAPTEPATAATTPTPKLDVGAHGRARSSMKTLGTTLKGALVKTMKADGPTAALQVCASDAQSLTASVAAGSGVRVGRSSLRLRNPKNAGPSWVTDWLKTQGERSAMEVGGQAAAATREDGTGVVRVLAPIAIEAPCLICHGPDEGRSPELSAILAEKYPTDKATGYALGDLRGAIWAEAPVVDTGMALQLDGTAKWQLDESTRNAIAAIRTALHGPAPTDLPGSHALAKTVDASLTEMIQGCTMEGVSHEQLHVFLQAFFPAIAALKKSTTLEEANQSRWLMVAQVAEVEAFFE